MLLISFYITYKVITDVQILETRVLLGAVAIAGNILLLVSVADMAYHYRQDSKCNFKP